MWYSNYHREENKHRQLYKCPICKKNHIIVGFVPNVITLEKKMY